MSDEVEDRLRTALGRVAAPEGFADRVVARLEHKRRMAEWTRWGAVAATVALLVVGWSEYRQYQARRNEQQVLFALRLATEKISRVDQRIRRSARQIHLSGANWGRIEE